MLPTTTHSGLTDLLGTIQAFIASAMSNVSSADIRLRAVQMLVEQLPTLPTRINIAVFGLVIASLAGLFVKLALVAIVIAYATNVGGIMRMPLSSWRPSTSNWIFWLGLPALVIIPYLFSSTFLLLTAGVLVLAKCFILPELEEWAEKAIRNANRASEQNANEARLVDAPRFFGGNPTPPEGGDAQQANRPLV